MSKNLLSPKANNRLKIAIPKKGRLRNPTIKLLQQAGLEFNTESNMLHVACLKEPIDLFFLRTQDIPTLIENNIADIGITGKDNVDESRANLSEILHLGFGACSLCLSGEKAKYTGIQDLKHKRIATGFPLLTKKFFHKHKVPFECIKLSGSLEIMIALGVCDAIVDISETGLTLQNNNLEIYEVLDNYYTGLFVKPENKNKKSIIELKKRLNGILISRSYSIIEFNIKKSLLKKAEIIAPGFDAPTISHLDNPSLVAVRVMIKKHNIYEIFKRLEELGATAIFEIEIKNCRL